VIHVIVHLKLEYNPAAVEVGEKFGLGLNLHKSHTNITIPEEIAHVSRSRVDNNISNTLLLDLHQNHSVVLWRCLSDI
jgi:hypothetical protein